MKKIKANDLINSEEFIREPVDKEINEILNSTSEKTILTGGRGIGKSTILYSLQNRGLGSREQTIYYCPESIITLQKEPNEYFNSIVFDYLYELRFSNNLLNYIKSKYPLTFNKYFKDDKKLVNNLLDELYKQINASAVEIEGLPITINVATKELSLDILKRFRETLEIEKMNIAIDRFDWVNGSSEYVQKLHKKYFDMFDKVILTSDDKTIDKEDLAARGYNIKEITYGKDKEVLREILKRRIQLNNKSENEKIDKNKKIELFDFMYDLHFGQLDLNGNIELALEIVNYTDLLFSWKDNTLPEDIVREAADDRKESAKKLEAIMTKPKLHL